MRRTAVLLGLGLVATWGVPALAATAGVRVGSFYFEDASAGDGRVTVAAGDRIRFTFEGNAQHTATVDALFDSGQRSGGETYTTGALAAGTYSLYCQVHGAPNHATTLVVRAAASPAPPPSASPSPSPSPRPSPTAKASPRVSPTPSPRPAPASAVTSPAASPAASTSAAPTSSPIVVRAAPSPVSLSPQAPTGSPSATASPLAVEPRGSATSSGTGWGVPVLFVLGVLLAAVGTVVAARGRRTP